MTDTSLIRAATDVEPDWMTQVLRRAGVIGDARVTAIAATPIGNGLVADSYRLALTYDGAEPGAPAAVVGKFPASDPTSRKSGTDHYCYAREVAFYREMAPVAVINTPRALLAEIDPATDDFTLILADLAPARGGDQLAGCSVADAETALGEAAALHAARWGDPALAASEWLAIRPGALAAHVNAILPGIIALFRERYEGRMEPELFALIDRLPAALARSRADATAPRTVIHGDFRLDNILFEPNGGAAPMATLDWQTVAHGVGAADASYFISAGLSPADRRTHERDLVAGYHDALVRQGVAGYGVDQCWRDYRAYALHGIVMGVISPLSVERTPRGDAQFLKMARGACEQALDLGTFDIWAD